MLLVLMELLQKELKLSFMRAPVVKINVCELHSQWKFFGFTLSSVANNIKHFFYDLVLIRFIIFIHFWVKLIYEFRHSLSWNPSQNFVHSIFIKSSLSRNHPKIQFCLLHFINHSTIVRKSFSLFFFIHINMFWICLKKLSQIQFQSYLQSLSWYFWPLHSLIIRKVFL